MKSLLITKVFPPETGGSGRWFWEIYSRLPQTKYHIIAGDHAEAKEFDRTHDLCLSRISFDFPDWGYYSWNGFRQYQRAMKQIAGFIDLNEIESVHTGSLLPDGWIARNLAKKLNVPLTVYMHGEETCYTSSSRQLGWMGKKILQDASCVIANSLNTEKILKESWSLPKSKIHVLHPGVDCKKFIPAEPDEQMRDNFAWKGRKVILTVGRLQERKGQDMLIQALPALARSIPEILYVIVGHGRDLDRLRKLTEERSLQNHVQFHQSLDDDQIRQCYQQSDLFVLPNRRVGDDIEGFGMVLLEAQACGKFVIAGDSGGTHETMKVGETGLIIDCTTPVELEKTIASLLEDPEKLQRSGIKGREMVEQKFDWSKLAGQAENLFEQYQKK